MANAKDFVLKCDRLPVLLTIEGDGCVEIGTEGMMKPNVVCGPGLSVLTNLKTGIVKMHTIPGEGMDTSAVIGIPKNKNTRINKPYYSFYYTQDYLSNGKMLEITVKFKARPDFIKPPDGNILGL